MWPSKRGNSTRTLRSWKASSVQKMAMVGCTFSDWCDQTTRLLRRNAHRIFCRSPMEVFIPISTTSSHCSRPRRSLKFQTSTFTSSAMAVTLLLVPLPNMRRNSSTSLRRRRLESSSPSSADTMLWTAIRDGRGLRSLPRV